MPDRNLAPQELVEGFKEKSLKFAEEHGLAVNPKNLFKVEWMQEHGGRCFCDPFSNRICPCKNMNEDIQRFNGNCLCGVFMTYKKLKEILGRKPSKQLTEEEKKNLKIRAKLKAEQSKLLFDKIIKK